MALPPTLDTTERVRAVVDAWRDENFSELEACRSVPASRIWGVHDGRNAQGHEIDALCYYEASRLIRGSPMAASCTGPFPGKVWTGGLTVSWCGPVPYWNGDYEVQNLVMVVGLCHPIPFDNTKEKLLEALDLGFQLLWKQNAAAAEQAAAVSMVHSLWLRLCRWFTLCGCGCGCVDGRDPR